jgi:hypothetical protein
LWDKFRFLELHFFWDGGSIYMADAQEEKTFPEKI